MKNKSKTMSGIMKRVKTTAKKTASPKKSLTSGNRTGEKRSTVKKNDKKSSLKRSPAAIKSADKPHNIEILEKYQNFLQNIHDGCFELDLDGRFIFFNDSVCRIFGYSREELMGLSYRKYTDSENAQKVFEEYHKVVLTGHPSKGFGWQIIRKDGAVRYIETSVSLQKDSAGTPTGFIGIANDITERKTAEDDLKKSEALYRLLADNITEHVWIMDLKLNLIYISPSVEKVYGYSLDDIKNIKLQELFTAESRKKIVEMFSNALSHAMVNPPPVRGTRRILELQARHKDGHLVWTENRVSFIRDENGKPVSILGETMDITERRKAEEELRRSEERYRTILEEIQEGYFEIDLAGNFTFFNDTLCRVSGYSRAELMGMNNRQYTDQEELRKVYRAYHKVYLTGESEKELIWTIRTKSGAIKYIEGSISLIKDTSGKPTGFRGVARDITERIQIEKKLKEEEQRFRTLAEQSSDIIVLLNRNGSIIYENPAVEKVLGLKAEERIGATGFEYLHPDDVQLAADTCNLLLKDLNAPVQRSDLRFRHADGSWRTLETVATNLIHDNVIEGIIINFRDVTEQKNAENLIRESERKYRLIAEKMTDIVWTTDLNLQLTYVSPSVKNVLGYTPEERMSQALDEQMTPQSLSLVMETMSREMALEKQGPVDPQRTVTLELEFYHKDGAIRWMELVMSRIRDERGVITGVHGVSRDITARRNAEILLKKNEEQYRLLADHMKDQVWLMDMKLNITYVSPSTERLTGYSFDEITKLGWKKLLTPESFQRALDFMSVEMPKALKASSDYLLYKTVELEFVLKGGRTVWGECEFSFIRDEKGQAVSILGESRNITERKIAEEKLKETLERLKKAVGTTIQVLVSALEARDPYTSGHQSRAANLASAIAVEMGLDPDVVEGLNMAGMIHDIGKLSIPAEILTKPSRLTDLEYSLIKEHAQSGYEMLKDVDSPWPLAEIVYQHHERIDGTGYPRGRRGEEILLEARILAVADVVEAMASHRPYRAALGLNAAVDEIEKNRGLLYDAAVVDACLRLFREKNYQLE